jgi:hypothetical protein
VLSMMLERCGLTGTLRGTKSRMPTIMPIRLHVSVGKMLRLSVIGALLGGTASGQEVQSQAEKLAYGAGRPTCPTPLQK